ncbi:hypothetical protein MNBD_GAMMA07-1830 [hydrothermal vent metagenome]|uniref:DUF3135 domain-containing protein n=1 Tax=hydrothermal vent metagenome TaxID=652676 RepID=A0A3B0WX27_9ZZZZ
MLLDLPDFEHLRKLADENPEELDFLCHYYTKRLIDSAPKAYQKRLKGISFQLELTRRRSKNPIQSCIAISKMMMDSFAELNNVLNDNKDQEYGASNKIDSLVDNNECQVIPFEKT